MSDRVEVYCDDRVEVYCDDESTGSGMHKGRTVTVIVFELRDVPDGGGARWSAWRPTSSAHYHRRSPAEVTRLLEQRRETRTKDAWKPRFIMRCALCGLDVQALPHRVLPAISRLRHAEIEAVSLTALSKVL